MSKPFQRITMTLALLAAACAVGGFTGCATGIASAPKAEEMGAAGVLPEGLDINAFRRGRATYVTECAACHKLFPPTDYSPEQWRGIVRRMSRRASLGGSQAEDLLLYLSAAGRIGK